MHKIYFYSLSEVTVYFLGYNQPLPKINALMTGDVISVNSDYPSAVKGCESDMLRTSVLFLLVSTSSLDKRGTPACSKREMSLSEWIITLKTAEKLRLS